jgi:hypothetical protein
MNEEFVRPADILEREMQDRITDKNWAIARLSAENLKLRIEIRAATAAMLAVCQTAGGHVERHATSPVNILERIRELRTIENHYLYPSQMDRYPEGK